MKHEVDTQGWPLVPCDPKAIPEGYEAVKVTWPTKEESFSCGYRERVVAYSINRNDDTFSVCLVIRPIKPPIELPLSIVPPGWWVAKDSHGVVHVFQSRPLHVGTCPDDEVYKLPPWIAAQLPSEWHELPWDKSAVQQTRKGADES